MPSMLCEQKLHKLVHECFETSRHVQTRPMHPDNTRPDTSYAARGYTSGHVWCTRGFNMQSWLVSCRDVIGRHATFRLRWVSCLKGFPWHCPPITGNIFPNLMWTPPIKTCFSIHSREYTCGLSWVGMHGAVSSLFSLDIMTRMETLTCAQSQEHPWRMKCHKNSMVSK